MTRSITLCSCSSCGNQRRHGHSKKEQLTSQELFADKKLEEFNSPKEDSEMVGGRVIEVIEVPEEGRTWINVQDASSRDECAVYIESKEEHKIEIGDEVWWLGPVVHWTSKDLSKGDIHFRELGLSGAEKPVSVYREKIKEWVKYSKDVLYSK